MKLYEGLFLIDAGRAARDWDATETELHSILEKHGVTIKEKVRYEERKLAYPIKRARRGVYYLVYFEAEPTAIQEIHADLNLTDVSLREMITRVYKDEIPEIKPLGNTHPARPPAPTPEPEEKPEPEPEPEAKPEPEAEAKPEPAAEAPAEAPAEEAPAEEKAEEASAEEKAEPDPVPAAATEEKKDEE